MKKLENYTAVLAVGDLDKSLAFYVGKLGFNKESSFGTPPYVAEVRRDDAQSISLLCQKNARIGSNLIATLIFRCHGIDELYQEFLRNGVLIDEEIGNKEYGMREFRIKDPDGYLIYFQEHVGS